MAAEDGGQVVFHLGRLEVLKDFEIRRLGNLQQETAENYSNFSKVREVFMYFSLLLEKLAQ